MDFSQIDKAKYIEAKLVIAAVEAEDYWDRRQGPAVIVTKIEDLSEYLSTTDAAELIGYGRTKFKQLQKTPGFPKPYGNPLAPRWKRTEMEKWKSKQKPVG